MLYHLREQGRHVLKVRTSRIQHHINFLQQCFDIVRNVAVAKVSTKNLKKKVHTEADYFQRDFISKAQQLGIGSGDGLWPLLVGAHFLRRLAV